MHIQRLSLNSLFELISELSRAKLSKERGLAYLQQRGQNLLSFSACRGEQNLVWRMRLPVAPLLAQSVS